MNEIKFKTTKKTTFHFVTVVQSEPVALCPLPDHVICDLASKKTELKVDFLAEMNSTKSYNSIFLQHKNVTKNTSQE